MKSRVIDWIVLNLLGLTGNLYISKRNNRYPCYPQRIVIDPSVLIVFTLTWIFIAVFFGGTISSSGLPSVKDMSEIDKFWYGVKLSGVGYLFTFVVVLLIRWACTDNTSTYKVNGVVDNSYVCRPVLSWKLYNKITDEEVEEERQLKKSKLQDEERELENLLREEVNKIKF